MMILGDIDGTIEMGRHTMDAITGEEFAGYLRHQILPEQRRFAAIAASAQDN